MPEGPAMPQQALGLEAVAMTKRFGAFTALEEVSVKILPGSVHALLGENGAGKSTLVKCIMGYYRPDSGAVIVGDREQAIDNPRILRDHRGDLRQDSVQRLIQALHHGFVTQDDRGQHFHIVAQASDFARQPL